MRALIKLILDLLGIRLAKSAYRPVNVDLRYKLVEKLSWFLNVDTSRNGKELSSSTVNLIFIGMEPINMLNKIIVNISTIKAGLNSGGYSSR